VIRHFRLLPVFIQPTIRKAEILPSAMHIKFWNIFTFTTLSSSSVHSKKNCPLNYIFLASIFGFGFCGILLRSEGFHKQKSLRNTDLKEDVYFSGAVYPWSSQAGYSSIHHHSTNKNCARGLQYVMWWHRETDPQTSAYHHLTLTLNISPSN
jgi:hypothetical protein